MSAWQIGRTEICRCGKFSLKTTGRAQWLTQWVGPWIWWAMEVLDIVSVHGVHASNIFKLCQSYAEVSPSEERAASWNRDVTAIISNYFKDLSPVWLAGLELDFESRWFRIKKPKRRNSPFVWKYTSFGLTTLFDHVWEASADSNLGIACPRFRGTVCVISDNMWWLGGHMVMEWWMSIFCLDPPSCQSPIPTNQDAVWGIAMTFYLKVRTDA